MPVFKIVRIERCICRFETEAASLAEALTYYKEGDAACPLIDQEVTDVYAETWFDDSDNDITDQVDAIENGDAS